MIFRSVLALKFLRQSLIEKTNINLLRHITGSCRCYSYISNSLNNDSNIKMRYFVISPKVSFVSKRFYADYPEHKIINLPNLSPTMETGSIVSWGRQEGDAISEGDLLAEIETDKATMSMDASDDGFLAKILVEAGTKDLPIGTPLCVVVTDEADIGAFKDFKASPMESKQPVADKPTASTPSAPTPTMPSPPATETGITSPSVVRPQGSRVVASPMARKIAKDKGLDLSRLQGTGPDGRITAADLEGASVGPIVGGIHVGAEWTDIELSSIRSVIAKRLSASKRDIPHYYLTMDVCMDRLIKIRQQINESSKDTKLSVNDFVIKAAAKACITIPEANSEWRETSIRQYSSVDVSVAVATDAGLITPIIFGADSKGLRDINREVMDLVVKAKENRLRPEEFQGGTFTVSNLGMFGITNFSAIINPPQACILAVGGSQTRLVPDDKSDLGFKKSVWMSVTLCSDHRIVDGAVGARWLQEFKKNLEEPTLMLL